MSSILIILISTEVMTFYNIGQLVAVGCALDLLVLVIVGKGYLPNMKQVYILKNRPKIV